MDRPLTPALESGTTPVSPACVDAETLAAWADKGLSAQAMADVEAHLADCARCQAVLAAFVTSEPAAAASAPAPFWRRWSLPWLVPVAAAAAVLVWVAMPHRTTPAPSSTVARVEQRDVPPAATQPVPPQAAAEPATPARRESVERPASPPPAQASGVARPRSDEAERTAPAQSKTAVPASSESAANRALASEAAEPAGVIEIGPPASPQAFGAVADTAQRLQQPTAVRWRIVANSRVERARGGGAWETVPLGVSAVLTAGSAPSASVCWLVGRGGLVLRSVDNGPFERRPFPEITDLQSIRAADGRQAVVVTTDGRAFSTVDGGLTWTPAR